MQMLSVYTVGIRWQILMLVLTDSSNSDDLSLMWLCFSKQHHNLQSQMATEWRTIWSISGKCDILNDPAQ